MTVRERFHKVMEGDASVDESPVIEWALWWDETLREWEAAGMPKGMSDNEIYEYFGLDKNTQFWFPHYQDDCPQPKSKYSGAGIVADEKDYERLRKFFLPEDAVQRMRGKIEETLPLYEKGETIVWYTLNGFFWFPRELFGPEAHLYSFYDYPELYHRMCEDLAEWHIKVIDEFAQYMHADFMTIAEDMSYNMGPMISEEMFEEFIKPYYERVIPEIKKYGTKVFVDTDGRVDKAVPWFLNAGVDGVLPLERQSGVDVNELRKKYPQLIMIGGFDKTCMFRGKEAIRQEVERLLPVIRSGKYLIGMDHQTPPGTTMEDYRYYLSLLREYGRQVCKEGYQEGGYHEEGHHEKG